MVVEGPQFRESPGQCSRQGDATESFAPRYFCSKFGQFSCTYSAFQSAPARKQAEFHFTAGPQQLQLTCPRLSPMDSSDGRQQRVQGLPAADGAELPGPVAVAWAWAAGALVWAWAAGALAWAAGALA